MENEAKVVITTLKELGIDKISITGTRDEINNSVEALMGDGRIYNVLDDAWLVGKDDIVWGDDAEWGMPMVEIEIYRLWLLRKTDVIV
jgi:hypothetical protein